MNKSKIKVGDSFTYLIVIEETNKRKRGAKLWKCRCKCGNLTEVKTDYLQQGWTKSCGCFSSQRAKERLPEIWAKNPKKLISKEDSKLNTLIRSYKQQATKRNLEFYLTNIEIVALVTAPCYYCNYKPENISNNDSSTYSDLYNGIDRRNNDLGYTLDNSVPCCQQCNKAKRSLTYKQFFEWLNRIIKHNSGNK